MWTVQLPTRALCAIVPWPKAPLPDVFGHRRLYQCKFTSDAAQRIQTASIEDELKKSGLLTEGTGKGASPTTQRVALAAMVSHWAAGEARWLAAEGRGQEAALERRAEDFVPHRQTMGQRHLYPLCLLLQPPSTGASAGSVETTVHRFAVAPDSVTEEVPSDQPMPVPTAPTAGTASTKLWVPATTTGGRATGATHRRWCEFRFVVTDPKKMASTSSPTVAVFERSGTDAAWEVAYAVKPPDSDPSTQDLLSKLQGQLREDVELTLIAVTVTHVADPCPR